MWRLGCKICALDLEPIYESLIADEEDCEPKILILQEVDESQERRNITSMQTGYMRSDSDSDMPELFGAAVSE